MLIGSLIGFGALIVSWLVLPHKASAAETEEAMPPIAAEFMPSQAH